MLCGRGRAFCLHFQMRIVRFGEETQYLWRQSLSLAYRLPLAYPRCQCPGTAAPHPLCPPPWKVPFLGEGWDADLILFVKLRSDFMLGLSPCVCSLPQHLSLYLQDVCPRDGGAGGGDRSLAHRHERAQVSRPDHGSLLQSPGRQPLGSLLLTLPPLP